MNTNFLPSQAIFSNGQITGNEWGTPENIFLVDGDFATSNVNQGSASDFIISNFNTNIPVGSTPTGIEIEIIGKRGAQTSPVITLEVDAYNNVNGADDFYPYTTPITSLTEDVTTIVIGSPTYLFGRSWTVDEINNLKLALTANGDISLDSVLVKIYYTGPATETLSYSALVGVFDVGEEIVGSLSGATAIIVTDNASDSMSVTNVVGFFQGGETITGQDSGATALLDSIQPGLCIDCSSPIQVQAMYLELPFLIGQTKFYLKKGSFSYPNGIPVQPGDIGSCGGTIPFVFDESKRKIDGQNFEENAMLDTNDGGVWTVLASGIIEVDLGSVNKRGLDYKTPANHVAANMSDHDANSKVIISNNEPYNLTLVRRCQVDTVFSPPITVQDEGVLRTSSLHLLNFVGEGVLATLSALHNILVTITDRFVRVNSSDTTSGYLDDKITIIDGSNTTVAKTILNPGANEKIQYQINATGGGGSDGKVKVDAADTTSDYLDPKLNLHSSDNSVNISKSITNPAGNEVLDYDFIRAVGGSIILQQTFVFGDFALDGFGNRVASFIDAMPIGASPVGVKYEFTVAFNAGRTMGVLDDDPAGQVIGTDVPADTIATLVGQTAGSAIFDWSVTPNPVVVMPGVAALTTGSVIVSIIGSGSAGQNAIQFEDEGTNLGTPGTVTELDFVGAGINAARVGNKVTVTGGQAGIQFQDEGSNLGTSDTVTTVNFTGAGVAASRASNVVTVAIAGGGGSFAPQYMFQYVSAGYSSVASLIGDNSVVWTATEGLGIITIARYEKNITGQYLKTHSATITSSPVTPDQTYGVGIVALGSYVYVAYGGSGGTNYIIRFNGNDLGSQTTMSISGTIISNGSFNRGCFTDGTNLYFSDTTITSGTKKFYTVSGTTLTYVGNEDWGEAQHGAYCDGTNVYFLNYDGDTVKKMDLTGTLLDTYTFDPSGSVPNIESSNRGCGITYLSDNSFICYMGVSFDDNGLYLITIDNF